MSICKKGRRNTELNYSYNPWDKHFFTQYINTFYVSLKIKAVFNNTHFLLNKIELLRTIATIIQFTTFIVQKKSK